MNSNQVEFAEFSLSRELKAKASDVYSMFADKQKKEQWFGAPNGF
ncbi:MAG TPA: hypothetical protein VIH90_03980 [Candidatus Saccharimonadales bacterium]